MQIIVPDIYSHLAPHECKLVRIGDFGDGGYVIPEDDCFEIEGLISIGISDNWSFESQIAKYSPNCMIYGFDRTSGSMVFAFYLLKTILSTHRLSIKTKLMKKWFQLSISFLLFWRDKHRFSRRWVVAEKKSEKEISISEVFSKIEVNRKIGIKIDIEENEYALADVLVQQVKERNSNIKFFIIEFHNISGNQDRFISLTKNIQSVLKVAHIHANNYGGIGEDGFPDVVEITFSSSQSLNSSQMLTSPNRSFDKPCNPLSDEIEITFLV